MAISNHRHVPAPTGLTKGSELDLWVNWLMSERRVDGLYKLQALFQLTSVTTLPTLLYVPALLTSDPTDVIRLDFNGS